MKGLSWHSNAIMERVANNQVKTSSGNIYILQGHMDSASMRKEGKKMIFNAMLLSEKVLRLTTASWEAADEVTVLHYPAHWAQQYSAHAGKWLQLRISKYYRLIIIAGIFRLLQVWRGLLEYELD